MFLGGGKGWRWRIERVVEVLGIYLLDLVRCVDSSREFQGVESRNGTKYLIFVDGSRKQPKVIRLVETQPTTQ